MKCEMIVNIGNKSALEIRIKICGSRWSLLYKTLNPADWDLRGKNEIILPLSTPIEINQGIYKWCNKLRRRTITLLIKRFYCVLQNLGCSAKRS